MAKINQRELVQFVHDYLTQHGDTILIMRLAELLNLSPEQAADWLICKVAAFRGCSEAEIAAALGVEVERE